MTGSWFTVGEDCVRIAVRLTPRASRTTIVGPVDDGSGRVALGFRIAAPPVEGAANAELVTFLAKALGLPRSAIAIQSGEKSRIKMLVVHGDPCEIRDRLQTLCAPAKAGA